MPKTNANILTKQTIKALDICGFEAWRQNNGGIFDPTKKVFRRGSSTPGIPDVLGYHRKTGKFIAVEIKAGKDKLSPFQERFLNGVKKAGGWEFVVRSGEDIEAIINLFRRPDLIKSTKQNIAI